MKKTVLSVLALLGAAIFVTGCGGSTSTNVLPDPVIRFINASPDSTLDAKLNEVAHATAVPYLSSTAGFTTVKFIEEADGGFDCTVIVPGTENEVRDAQLFTRDLSYLWIAFGLNNNNNEQTKRLDQVFFAINREAPIGSKSHLIIFNALAERDGQENSPIDFQSYDPANPASADNPQYQKQALVFGAYDSTKSNLDIDSGTRTFQARQNGSDAALVYAEGTFTFVPGKIYVALVSGKVNDVDPAKRPKITFIEIATKG
ncbi:MAG: hypothetical protein K8R88_10990 [Armatimonadetes bacterium]|nr:hypothetical protein [Armatimonadota bacterium]